MSDTLVWLVYIISDKLVIVIGLFFELFVNMKDTFKINYSYIYYRIIIRHDIKLHEQGNVWMCIKF